MSSSDNNQSPYHTSHPHKPDVVTLIADIRKMETKYAPVIAARTRETNKVTSNAEQGAAIEAEREAERKAAREVEREAEQEAEQEAERKAEQYRNDKLREYVREPELNFFDLLGDEHDEHNKHVFRIY